MATITQDNIQFTNIQPNNIFANSGKYSISFNDDGTGKFDTTIPGDELTKSLNAVEIDWNGAVLPNGNPEDATDLTINTTGELLRMIINTGSPMWAN